MERQLKATAATVIAKLTDPAWLEARCLALGELAAKVKVKTSAKGVVTLTMKRRVRRELPPLVASVLPSESDLLFTEVWTPDGQGGYDGELRIDLPGHPVDVSAEFTLENVGKGSVFAIEHDAQCSLPLIGRTVAAVAQQLVESGCEDELDYLAQALATKPAKPRLAKKAPAAKAPAKQAPTKQEPAPTKKATSVKKSAPAKKAPAKKAPTIKVDVKQTATKKSIAKKAAR